MLKLNSLFHSGLAALAAAGFLFAGMASAGAQNAAGQNLFASAFPDRGSENLFGFTDGSDIGQPGEKEIEWETEAARGKRSGKYFAAEHHLAYGYNPNDQIHLEAALLGVSTNIKNVPDFDNKTFSGLAGVSAELKYLILTRGPASPIGLTFKVEPEYAWIDDGDGSKVRKAAVETALIADAELIPNKLYLASNIIYEPEVVHPKNGDPTEHESSLAFTGALSYRLTGNFALGAEVQYMRAYDQGIGLNHFTGDATYVGPTLRWQIIPKGTLSLAWGHQVRGHSDETPASHVNLVDFSRDIAKLKFDYEFF